MVREETYKRSVDVLFNAYFNDALQHGSCSACAVGNILNGEQYWGILFITMGSGRDSTPTDGSELAIEGSVPHELKNYYSESTLGGGYLLACDESRAIAARLVEKSGYSVAELKRIEFAFEAAPQGDIEQDWEAQKEDYMYNGLVAVLEVLADIHHVVDQDITPITDHHQNKKAMYLNG